MLSEISMEEQDAAPSPSQRWTNRAADRAFRIWCALFEYLVPLGYEDENGFHFGEPAAWEFCELTIWKNGSPCW